MAFEPYGFDDGFGEDYDTFVASIMGLSALLKMKGNHDYHVMEKEGNAYLIIDTEEIPILDAKQIDDTYGKIIEGLIQITKQFACLRERVRVRTINSCVV